MFSVTPIGSCRITTPLRRGQSQHGFLLNLDRCYGYCHSPGEAVQKARFLRGSGDIPAQAWPLVSRAHDLEDLRNTAHDRSDLYIVELSSAKEVTLDGVYVQLNYLKNAFSDFFANPERSGSFWEIAENGDAVEMRAFLDQVWSRTKAQRGESDVLSQLRLGFVTEESLRRDINHLVDMLGEVMFVSHVNAVKSDGQPIKSRAEFIELVEAEVANCGAQFFNPTDLMAEFGQSKAIEDESTGLAHFTEQFGDEMMQLWMRDVIAPSTDKVVRERGAPVAEKLLRPQVLAASRQGRLAETQMRLDALSGASDDMSSLRVEIETAQEQARAAFHGTYSTFRENNSNDVDALDLLDRSTEIGLFDIAIEIVEGHSTLLSRAPLYRVIHWGRLARNSGALDAALVFFAAAAARGSQRGQQALLTMAAEDGVDILKSVDLHCRDALIHGANPLERLQILQRNSASFTEAVTASTPAQEVLCIAEHLANTHSIGHAAEIVAHWRDARGPDVGVGEELTSLLDGWVEKALMAADYTDRIHGLNAVLFAAPKHRLARNTMRDTRNELALLIRSAGRAGDIEKLDALVVSIRALTQDLPELDLWRARLRFAAGEFEKAIDLGQAAAQLLPDKINNWVLLMRAALKLADHGRAREFARKVIELSTRDTERLKREAEAVLEPAISGA